MKPNSYSPPTFKKFSFRNIIHFFNYSLIWDVEVVEQVKMVLPVVAKAMVVAAAADATG